MKDKRYRYCCYNKGKRKGHKRGNGSGMTKRIMEERGGGGEKGLTSLSLSL